jgi:hypothetical protein
MKAMAAPRSVKIIRWTARIWSIFVTVFLLLIFFSPDSGGPGPIALVDKLLLSLTGVALIGLFIAWQWGLAGGIFTIAMLFIREIVWAILKGQRLVGFLVLWILIAPPAIMFLIAGSLDRKSENRINPAG